MSPTGTRAPSLGQKRLLIYRECGCGAWLATPEGAIAPICSECDEMFQPLGGSSPRPAEPQEIEEWARNRREVGRAFYAPLLTEVKAAERER